MEKSCSIFESCSGEGNSLDVGEQYGVSRTEPRLAVFQDKGPTQCTLAAGRNTL